MKLILKEGAMKNNFLKKLRAYDFDSYLKLSMAQGAAPAWLSQANTPGFISGNVVTGFGVHKARSGSNMNIARSAANGRARNNIIQLIANHMGLKETWDISEVAGVIRPSQPENYIQENGDGTFTVYSKITSPLSNVQMSNTPGTAGQRSAQPAARATAGKQPQAQNTATQGAPPAWLSQTNTPGFISGNQVTGFGTHTGHNKSLTQGSAKAGAKINAIRLVANQMKVQAYQISGVMQFSQPEIYLKQNADNTFTAYAKLTAPLPSAKQQPASSNQSQSPKANQQATDNPNQGPAAQKNTAISDEVIRKRRERALSILREGINPGNQESSDALGTGGFGDTSYNMPGFGDPTYRMPGFGDPTYRMPGFGDPTAARRTSNKPDTSDVQETESAKEGYAWVKPE